jgi:hypothetical protein
MAQPITHRLSVIGVSIILTCFTLTACAPPMPAAGTAPSSSLDEQYSDAIHRSAVIDPGDIDRHPLLSVDRSHRTTTVVTWTTIWTANRYYSPGKSKLGTDVWVTLAPQVHDLCAGFPADPASLTLRLQQLLGLPPKPEDRVFVVMDVPSASLFRPCPDPDPTKSSCGWAFPPNATDRQKAWFADQVVDRYREAPDGYPWTRLGYTYDWAPGASGFGASEFVLPKGTPVIVKAAAPTVAYCHPG